MMATIDLYAVFGYPIDHSLSPDIHVRFATETGQSIRYDRRAVTLDEFADAVTGFVEQGGKGLNCTVPLKEAAYTVSDHTSPRAQRARAVNTLLVCPDGQLYGDNTDGSGLVRDLTLNLSVSLSGKNILLIGAGGASRGILLPLLEQQPARLLLTNRTLARAEQLAAEFADFACIEVQPLATLRGTGFDLILNATSASLSSDLPELPEGIVAPGCLCYDLAYGSQPTAFVEWGLRAGADKSVDGIGMLVEQAADAFELWRGIRPQTAGVITWLRNRGRGSGGGSWESGLLPAANGHF